MSHYYTIKAAQAKTGLDQSFTPYISVLDDMIENRDEYIKKYGKTGYNQVYNAYLANAKGDIDNINEAMDWGNGGRFGADILEAYPWLKDQFVYDPKNPEDMMAKSLGYAPAALDQNAAKAYAAEANRIKADNKGAEDTTNGITSSTLIPINEIAQGNKPVTQKELMEALDVISKAHMIGPYEGLDQSKNLSDRGYGGTQAGGGQLPHRSVEENKIIVAAAQAYGLADAGIDIESLSPEELQITADEGIKKYNDALINYQYQHSGSSYSGAPEHGRSGTSI